MFAQYSRGHNNVPPWSFVQVFVGGGDLHAIPLCQWCSADRAVKRGLTSLPNQITRDEWDDRASLLNSNYWQFVGRETCSCVLAVQCPCPVGLATRAVPGSAPRPPPSCVYGSSTVINTGQFRLDAPPARQPNGLTGQVNSYGCAGSWASRWSHDLESWCEMV